MNLKVLFFGISTDLVGATSMVFSISPNTTILEFKTQLQEQYPQLTDINSYAIAVNESYAHNETVLKENDIVKSYKKDQNGDVVITKLNIDLLKNIANSSNGIYIDGGSTELVVQAIIERLKDMDKKEFESKQFVAYKDQFQWFLGFAILFLSLELIVFEKKTYWVKKLNLFNE